MGFLRLRYSVPINVGANQSYKFPIEYICEALGVESFFVWKNTLKIAQKAGLWILSEANFQYSAKRHFQFNFSRKLSLVQ